MAGAASQTETSVTHVGEIFFRQLYACGYSGQHQVKD